MKGEICSQCSRAQVVVASIEIDRIARDLEHDGDYEVVERDDDRGLLLLQGTEQGAPPAFTVCAECLTKTEW